MKLVMTMLALLVVTGLHAAPLTADNATLLNHGGQVMQKSQMGTTLREAHNQVVGVYDFAKVGGAAGTFTLTNSTLPLYAVVTNVWIDVATAPKNASGTTQLAWGYNNATDMSAYTNITSYTQDKVFQGGPAWITGSPVRITGSAALPLKLTVSGSALTGGRLIFFGNYGIRQ